MSSGLLSPADISVYSAGRRRSRRPSWRSPGWFVSLSRLLRW